MKKVFVFMPMLMLALTVVSIAQTSAYTPWQVSTTLGYAAAGGNGSKGGLCYTLEPQYHITDNITVGIRYAAAITAKASLTAAGDEVGDFSIAGSTSYQATGNYYFQKTPGAKFRPFAGVGLGFGRALGASSITTSTTYADDFATKSGFSGMMRAGFDISHFRFNLDYNLVPKTGRYKNSYFGVNFGFYIGGGATK